MSNFLPINWQDKVNNPELLAWLKQYGQEGYFTAEEINQLRDAVNELYFGQHFKGKFTSSSALITAIPTGTDGDYAIVDSGAGNEAKEWIWDNEAGWIQGDNVGPSTTDALPEGDTNKYFTTARVLATILSGLSLVTGGSIVSTDTVLGAFGKIQKQISDLVSNKQDVNEAVEVRNVTGSMQIDLRNKTQFITLTGNSTFNFLPAGLPTASNKSVTTTIYLKGAFSLTVGTPTLGIRLLTGSYTGTATKWNLFTIEVAMIDVGTGNQNWTIQISEPETQNTY